MDLFSIVFVAVVCSVIGVANLAYSKNKTRNARVARLFESVSGIGELYTMAYALTECRSFFERLHRTANLPGEDVSGHIVGLIGRLDDHDLALYVSLEPTSDEVTSVCMTVTLPHVQASAIELWSMPERMNSLALEYAPDWLDRRLRVGGEDFQTLSFLSHDVVDALGRAASSLANEPGEDEGVIADPKAPRGRGALLLRGGKIGFTASFGSNPTCEEIFPVVAQWLDLMRGILRALPAPGPNYALLAARARSQDEHLEARWRSVLVFADRMGTREHVLELMGQRDELPEEVVIALASIASRMIALREPLFDVEEQCALLERGLVLKGDLARHAALECARVDPWLVFVGEHLDARVRARCAGTCLDSRSVPEDTEARDTAIVSALAQGRMGAEYTADAFDGLVDAGWVPSHDALTVLASGAKSALAGKMIELILERGTPLGDAPALQILRDRGHADRVEALLLDLKNKAGDGYTGRLSVASTDQVVGGLTESKAGGTLSTIEESR